MGRLEPIVGTEIIDDIRLGHSWFEYFTLEHFIINQHPIWFIEVGVHEGGLSYCLMRALADVKYIGIELDCNLVRPAVIEMYKRNQRISQNYAELICGDCFSPEINDKLINLNSKIIYCDGGNKVTELRHFKNACNYGDIIMAHDFHDGIRKVRTVPREYFTPEVKPEDVKHLDNDETFERLDEDIFKETRIIGWKKK